MSRRRKAAICCAKATASLQSVEMEIAAGRIRGAVLTDLASLADQFADAFNARAIEGNPGDPADDDQ